MTFPTKEEGIALLVTTVSFFVCPKIFCLILTVELRGGGLMAAGGDIRAHKGNIFRPFLPPAVLRNNLWRGEEPHTRPAEKRPFLLPQDTAEMLCHPQVDTWILPVTFTFLSRNFAFFFPLPEITVCFLPGQAVAVVPCCFWAAQAPVFLPVHCYKLCDPTDYLGTTWGPPGDHLGSGCAGFPPSPFVSLGQIPLWALGVSCLCQLCEICPRHQAKGWRQGAAWHSHTPSMGWRHSSARFCGLFNACYVFRVREYFVLGHREPSMGKSHPRDPSALSSLHGRIPTFSCTAQGWQMLPLTCRWAHRPAGKGWGVKLEGEDFMWS